MWNSVDDGGFGKNKFDQQNGGGFLNSTINSPSTSEKKKPDRITNVVPCTIAQIHAVPESDDNLKIGSLTAKIITFIGVVESLDVQTTKITYVVSDHTGPSIDVQLWLGETDEQSNKFREISENYYIRVTGAIRSLKGKRHVIAFNMQPIKDLNEITMHMAEVIHTSMSISVMDKQQSASTTGYGTASVLSSGMMESSTDTFNSDSLRKLTKPQQLVKQAISKSKDEQGINVMELYNSLKSLNRQSIQEALEFLSNEGHIYSTIDEDHYKSTDSV
ncbi:replication protein A 32 kDa subunit [Trichonephila clavata]|uniref:Replication protein A 32 kDa subunit n=1 Tax=Trichonephila clavata TaxID=2740835 RepID=A0A8X6GB21_TRICU|nr:replication protein A 32 kDa subunit [Trichonephila clavata]